MHNRFYFIWGGFFGIILGLIIGFFLGFFSINILNYFLLVTEEKNEESDIRREEANLRKEQLDRLENKTQFLYLNDINIDIYELEKLKGDELSDYFSALALSFNDDYSLSLEAYVDDIEEVKDLNIDGFDKFEIVPRNFIMAPVHNPIRVCAKYGDISIILFYNSFDAAKYGNITLDNIGSEYKLYDILVIAPKEKYDESLFERTWTKTKDSHGNIIYRDYIKNYKVSYQNPTDEENLELLIRTKDSLIDVEEYYEEQYHIY